MSNKMQELFQNEEFVKEILPMSAEDAVAAFAREGVDVTADELKDLASQINAAAENTGAEGELTEDALTGVTGGILLPMPTLGSTVALRVAMQILCNW